jgi:hypothetical protein
MINMKKPANLCAPKFQLKRSRITGLARFLAVCPVQSLHAPHSGTSYRRAGTTIGRINGVVIRKTVPASWPYRRVAQMSILVNSWTGFY